MTANRLTVSLTPTVGFTNIDGLKLSNILSTTMADLTACPMTYQLLIGSAFGTVYTGTNFRIDSNSLFGVNMNQEIAEASYTLKIYYTNGFTAASPYLSLPITISVLCGADISLTFTPLGGTNTQTFNLANAQVTPAFTIAALKSVQSGCPLKKLYVSSSNTQYVAHTDFTTTEILPTSSIEFAANLNL